MCELGQFTPGMHYVRNPVVYRGRRRSRVPLPVSTDVIGIRRARTRNK